MIHVPKPSFIVCTKQNIPPGLRHLLPQQSSLIFSSYGIPSQCCSELSPKSSTSHTGTYSTTWVFIRKAKPGFIFPATSAGPQRSPRLSAVPSARAGRGREALGAQTSAAQEVFTPNCPNLRKDKDKYSNSEIETAQPEPRSKREDKRGDSCQ